MAAIWTAPRTATTGELETAAIWNTHVRDNEEYLKAYAVPTGMIAMFAGACPTGWTRYTALDGRYPKGAPAGVTSPLNTGGATTHTHTYTDVPSHTHTEGSAGDHAHTAQSAGAHTHTAQSAGSHTHTRPWAANQGTDAQLLTQGNGPTGAKQDAAAGAHTHTTDSQGAHTHSTNSQGSHTHTINSTGVATGTTASSSSEPPYKEVVFCQKS